MTNIVNMVQSLFYELKRETNDLKQYLRTNKPQQIICFELPAISAETKELPSFEERTITVKQITDHEQALALANRYLSNYFIEDNASKKFASRCPGIIQMKSEHKDYVVLRITRINRIKEEIKAAITAKDEEGIDLFTRSERFNILREAIPGVVTLKLYRKIQCIAQSLASISFTWANKQSITKIDLESLKKLLELNKKNIPSESQQNEWDDFINLEIKAVTDSKAKMFKFRRPVPAAPMVNLRFTDKTKAMRHAHLPIFIFGNEVIKVSPLKSYWPDTGHYRQRIEIEKYLINRLKIIPTD
ncbi:DNA replication terminus site-binding protein (plasmid) [Psychrobium sp. nBUS_13]|uniref:DNA replication terminus site-binding protein n=1 Tax=Psychrobium sp. nBUS_13 TaxID=3395319 RepID=UPI003EBD1340